MYTNSMLSTANSIKKQFANSSSRSFINSTPKSFANFTPNMQNKSTQGSSANSTPRTYTNLTQRRYDFTPRYRYSLSSQTQINSQYPQQNSLPGYRILPLTLKQLSLTLQQYLLYFNNYYKLMKYKSIQILVRLHGYHSSNHQTYIITDETMFMNIQIKRHIFKMSQEQQDFSKYYRLIIKLVGKQDLYSKGVSLNIEVQTVQPVLDQQQIEQHLTRAMIIQSQINLFWQESNFKDQLKSQILNWIKKNRKFWLDEIKSAFLNYDPHVFRMIFEQFQDQISDRLRNYGAVYQYILKEQNYQSQQNQKQSKNQEKQQQSQQEQKYREKSQQKQKKNSKESNQQSNKQVYLQRQQEQQQSQQEQQYKEQEQKSQQQSQQRHQQDSRMIQQKDEMSDEINENKSGQ